jgi:hypothetical protein
MNIFYYIYTFFNEFFEMINPQLKYGFFDEDVEKTTE